MNQLKGHKNFKMVVLVFDNYGLLSSTNFSPLESDIKKEDILHHIGSNKRLAL
jgi:hypothetical protein